MAEMKPETTTGEIEELFPGVPEKLTREELLKVTAGLIRHLQSKIQGRFRDQDLERMRDSKIRLLIESCKTHAAILKDEQLDDHEVRLRAIEGRGS